MTFTIGTGFVIAGIYSLACYCVGFYFGRLSKP